MRHYTLTVTSKGQVTLPADFRKAAGIETGATLQLVVDDEGQAHIRRRLTLDDIAGSLTRSVAPKDRNFTKADIKAGVAQAMDEQEERVRRKRRA
ncbi:AbrB/MazE/SpoVT family DNA-binding domain-containing protein [Xanthobacteraceae bacterium A53D]